MSHAIGVQMRGAVEETVARMRERSGGGRCNLLAGLALAALLGGCPADPVSEGVSSAGDTAAGDVAAGAGRAADTPAFASETSGGPDARTTAREESDVSGTDPDAQRGATADTAEAEADGKGDTLEDSGTPPAQDASDAAETSPAVDAGADSSADGSLGDAGDVDATLIDALPGDTPPADTWVPPVCPATIAIVEPATLEFTLVGTAFGVSAQVTTTGPEPLTDYAVEWLDGDGAVLATSPVSTDGLSQAVVTLAGKGKQAVRARATDANGPCASEAVGVVLSCQSQVLEDFSGALAPPWVVWGDASWEPEGWIEMTGPYQGMKGAVWNEAEYVLPGTVSIRASVLTGGGSGSGADGFAMSIIETDDPADLPGLATAGKGGGGLGYASGGPYGTFTGKAFTVEIDTWYNQLNDVELHTDPTPDDHVELTLDLDASHGIAWASLGEVEDSQWHQVRIDIVAQHVRVWFDGLLTVNALVPELDFRGGYIMFTGSTGFYTNYHRFDGLAILHGCMGQ